jgi:enoyl-CoA hydratase/carnithine racemase
MTDDILTTRTGRMLELRLNRPAKKNAITSAMYATLAEALGAAAEDSELRVVTILGSGGTFTSGNDLRDFQQAPPLDLDQPVFRFLRAISTFPKPLVAGVEGLAVGVGTTMLLHCDLVIAAANAQFSMPFVDLALVPEAGSSLLLPQLIGRHRAARHLMLGEPFDATTAFGYGLVTELVTSDLETRVTQVAEKIAAKPPEAVRMTKRLLRSGEEAVAARIEEEAKLFAARLSSPEAMEAFTAFFEKRPPNFG